MAKKAQLTIFIIVGIALILSVGVVVYLENQKASSAIEEVVIPIIAAVPAEVAPIQDFITNCISQVGRQGLKIIGERGGHINPLASGLNFNPVDPTAEKATAVEFSRGSKLIIPYWWYLNSKNECTGGDCRFDSKKPELYRRNDPTGNSIESQLDSYVKDNLADCIQDFSQFKQQGFEFEEGTLKVETTVAAKTVNFFVNWPVIAKNAGNEFSLPEFFTQETVAFKDIYSLGTTLRDLQAKYAFLETMTRNLLEVYGETDSTLLPPIDDLTFERGGAVTWIKSIVKKKITQMLMSQTPLLYVPGAANGAIREAPADVRDPDLYNAQYNRYFMVPSYQDIDNPVYYPSLSVDFNYLDDWSPYFDLNCDGDSCGPDAFGGAIGALLFNLQQYRFAYDISFPVLVKISDPSAFDGEGYSLQFFMESNVRKNEQIAVDYAPLIQEMPLTTEFCRIDNESSVITVNVLDNKAKLVSEAAIYYICGEASCNVGKTNSTGSFSGKFPSCWDGTVSSQSDDYFPANAPLDNMEGAQTVNLVMQPYSYLDFEAKKYPLTKTKLVYAPSFFGNTSFQRLIGLEWEDFAPKKEAALPLADDEEAVIIMTRIGAQNEDSFTAVADYIPNAGGDDLANEIKLVPGTYKVQVYLQKSPENDIVIPPENFFKPKKKNALGKTVREEIQYCVPDKKLVFNADEPFYAGKAEFEWTFDGAGSKATMYVPYLDLESISAKCHSDDETFGAEINWKCGSHTTTWCEREIDDLNMLSEFDSYDSRFPEAFEPDVS